MLEVSEAERNGDAKGLLASQRRVSTFTNQLNESNPILTQISDAMTREGHCLTQMKAAEMRGDADAVDFWSKEKALAEQQKADGNQRLMECSHRYDQLMRAIREEAANANSEV